MFAKGNLAVIGPFRKKYIFAVSAKLPLPFTETVYPEQE